MLFLHSENQPNKKKHVICEACLDAMAEFVLGAQLMMYPEFV